MNEIFNLLLSDSASLRGWFSRQTASKFIVLMAFVAIFTIVPTIMYFFSLIFFKNLTAYGVFGALTAVYIIHAAIVVIGFWATIGALSSAMTLLLNQNKKIDYLITLPIRPSVLTQWLFIKSSLINMVILTVGILPVSLAYSSAFYGNISVFYLLRVMLVLVLLVLASGSIGTSLAYIGSNLVRRRRKLVLYLSVLFFLLSTFILLRLIFPRSLAILYYSEPGQFEQIYNSLPLSNPWLPTGWLTLGIVSDYPLPLLYFGVFALCLWYLGQRIQTDRFLKIMQWMKAYPYHELPKSTTSFLSHSAADIFSGTRMPLVLKDWLSLVRTPSETGYVVFLCSIVVFFFALLIYASHSRVPGVKWQSELILFSYIWLLFFVSAFLLRLVFPLMAREKKTEWFLFTLPVNTEEIVRSKITVGLSIGLVLALAANFLWIGMPFTPWVRAALAVLSTLSVIVLACAHAIFGSIVPNFESGDDPEKVSTSATGIAALLFSVTVAGIGLYWFYGLLNQNKKIMLLALCSLALALVFQSLLYTISLKWSRNYFH